MNQIDFIESLYKLIKKYKQTNNDISNITAESVESDLRDILADYGNQQRQLKDSANQIRQLQSIIDDIKSNTVEELVQQVERLEQKLEMTKREGNEFVQKSLKEREAYQEIIEQSQQTIETYQKKHQAYLEQSDIIDRLKKESEQSHASNSQLTVELTNLSTVHRELESRFSLEMEERDQSLQKLNEQHQEELHRIQSEKDLLVQNLQNEIDALRQENSRLQSDCDSFQYLIQEQTFSTGNLVLRSIPPSNRNSTSSNNLQEELEAAAGGNGVNEELKKTIAMLEEDNRSLLLYINRILGKILECGEEAIDILAS